MYSPKVKVTSTAMRLISTKSINFFVFPINTCESSIIYIPPSAILVAMPLLKNDQKVAVGGFILAYLP